MKTKYEGKKKGMKKVSRIIKVCTNWILSSEDGVATVGGDKTKLHFNIVNLNYNNDLTRNSRSATITFISIKPYRRFANLDLTVSN